MFAVYVLGAEGSRQSIAALIARKRAEVRPEFIEQATQALGVKVVVLSEIDDEVLNGHVTKMTEPEGPFWTFSAEQMLNFIFDAVAAGGNARLRAEEKPQTLSRAGVRLEWEFSDDKRVVRKQAVPPVLGEVLAAIRDNSFLQANLERGRHLLGLAVSHGWNTAE